MTDIREYVRSYKKILEEYIENYLAERIAEQAEHIDRRISELYSIFKEASGGGKSIRGCLVKLGYELAANCPAGNEILPISAAFELFQTAILGHDDIIDKSSLRRGKDSIWQAVTRRSGSVDDGISQAICLGDGGIALANRLVAESSFSAERKIEALKTFLGVQLHTMDGEMLDVCLSREKNYDDEEGILKIARLKTAWYTIIGPLQLGAALGGGKPELLDALQRYGMPLGIAFQLQDDILGIEASESDTGKSNTSDIAEGKVTLLAHHAMKRATPEQLGQLRRIYGREDISETDRKTVREIFEATGALEVVARKAESFRAEAEEKIADITQDPEKRALLTQLGDMMIHRSS
jgi:geranylgeranyl diphosphate synthase type I